MKEEELIKKLENAELPSIETPSHQRRLKMVLLSAGYPQRRQGFALPVFITIIKGGIDIIMKGLLAKQPVWKTATISIVGLALILALSFSLPPIFSDSTYAKAADIVKNSPEVRAVLGGSDNESLEMVKVFLMKEDGTVSVVVRGHNDVVTADVDLGAGKVVEITPLGLTEAVREEAIAIAEADPAVRELLDKGAVISGMNYVYPVPEEANSASGEQLEALVRVVIEETDGSYWTADIDLDTKQVVNLEHQSEMLVARMTSGAAFSFIADGDNAGSEMTVTIVEVLADEMEGADYPDPEGPPVDDPIARIAEADPAVRELLDKGGRIVAGFQMDATTMDAAGEIIEEASLPMVIIELDGEYWQVEVDLEAGKVTGPPVLADSSVFHNGCEPE